MQPVVMVEAAEPGEEDLLLVGSVVAVGVGVDDQVRRCRHDHAMADHRQAQGRPEIRVLHEGLGAVGAAVAVAVREDDDPIARRVRQRLALGGVEAAVVDGFGDPHPPLRIDIDVRGVEEHRGLGPERDLEVVGKGELVGERLAGRR